MPWFAWFALGFGFSAFLSMLAYGLTLAAGRDFDRDGG